MWVENLNFALFAEECCIKKDSFSVYHKIDSKGNYNSSKKDLFNAEIIATRMYSSNGNVFFFFAKTEKDLLNKKHKKRYKL